VDEKLRTEALNILQKAGISFDPNGKCFENLKIWIGASSHNCAIMNLADAYEAAFEKLGASVSRSSKGQFSPAGEKHIDEADVVLVFAATPGASARALELCVRGRFEPGNDNVNKLHIYMPRAYSSGFIHRRFQEFGAHNIRLFKHSVFSKSENELFQKCLYDICDEFRNLRRKEVLRQKEFAPDIAIVTALEIELRMVLRILGEYRIDTKPDRIYQEYYHGEIPSVHGGSHRVVVARAGKGNNKAAVLADSLLSRYPTVQDIVMVGVAGGVPDVKDAGNHVRLGDIVICDEVGVIQYDMISRYTGKEEYRPPPRPPSHRFLLRAINDLAEQVGEPSYWSALDRILKQGKIRRPSKAPLKDCPWVEGSRAVRQPVVGNRNRPRIHSGPIASANTVLKSPGVRDAIKTKFKIKAVEMESSGIAEAAWQHEKGYFVVRGICDFANDGKNKIWQPYAAAAAAAYIQTLIGTLPVASKTIVTN